MARKRRAWHFLAWMSLLSELEGIVEIFARMVEDIASSTSVIDRYIIITIKGPWQDITSCGASPIFYFAHSQSP